MVFASFEICFHCEGQVDLEVIVESRLTSNGDFPTSTSQVLGLQAWATMIRQENKLTFKCTNFKRCKDDFHFFISWPRYYNPAPHNCLCDRSTSHSQPVALCGDLNSWESPLHSKMLLDG